MKVEDVNDDAFSTFEQVDDAMLLSGGSNNLEVNGCEWSGDSSCGDISFDWNG